MTWHLGELPDQTGRTILVTGTSTGGLGHHTALELARRGARVVLAGRSDAKLAETESAIRADLGRADLGRLLVDLADLSSVRRAGDQLAEEQLHVLVNNAGVMATPYRRTGDGLELHLATNHFGPFLLTGLLLSRLVASGDGRVVTVSSQAHRTARRAPLGDPFVQEGRYHRWQVYGQSKLANLLFTFELQRRLDAAGLPVRAMAAHPGFAGTHLVVNGQLGRSTGPLASIMDAAVRVVSQSAADGALPTLMAATADLPGGTYCGPSRMGQWRGAPTVVDCAPLARDRAAQSRLWELSEETVGLSYP
ncbi:MAG TPA: oxidoreductase [Nocardioides sp.]|uniref:oxidoreductase n=1 Tax=Nocardioides sp. TaxID=35761 RepID=UPI002CB75BA3|nr:oxidoreductase [Nocardioides sp.]HQR27046.1 oxidoreductase [Nocardioides sp.]